MRDSGAEEQLGDAALLADPGRPEEIARAVKAVHDDPALLAWLIDAGHTRGRRWTAREYVRGVLSIVDGLETAGRWR